MAAIDMQPPNTVQQRLCHLRHERWVYIKLDAVFGDLVTLVDNRIGLVALAITHLKQGAVQLHHICCCIHACTTNPKVQGPAERAKSAWLGSVQCLE